MPTFLSSPETLRDAVRAITAPSAGRRVVAAAFVGRDALLYIPRPRGIRIYCWPNPLATHPSGIADLIAHGAIVYFVKGMHAKVYWSEKAGALVASSNVSANALGDDSAQLEAGVRFENSNAIAIDLLCKKIHRLGAKLVTRERLAAFRALYDRTPRPRGKSTDIPPRTLQEYADLPIAVRTPFKLAWYHSAWHLTKRDLRPLVGRDALDYAEAESMVAFMLETSHRIHEGDWLLLFRRAGKRVLSQQWMFADRSVANPRSTDGWSTYQFVGNRREPPFDCTGVSFRRALQSFVAKTVDLKGDEVTMSAGRVKSLASFATGTP